MLNAVFFFATNFKRKCRPKNHLIRVVCLCILYVCVFVIEGRFRSHVRPVCALILALYMLYIPIGFESSSSLCVTWLMECYIVRRNGSFATSNTETARVLVGLLIPWRAACLARFRVWPKWHVYISRDRNVRARIKVEDRRAQYTDARMARGKDLQDN